ncbi:MAG: hypothetical protein ACXVCP_16470 [Bdellovibrio sp.]
MFKLHFYALILFFFFTAYSKDSLGSRQKQKQEQKSLEQIVNERPISINCENSQSNALDKQKNKLKNTWIKKTRLCSYYASTSQQQGCLNTNYFNIFADALQELTTAIVGFEKGNTQENTISSSIYSFFAITRDSLPENLNFEDELDRTINILLSGKYPPEMIEYMPNLVDVGIEYRTFIDGEHDLQSFLKEHKNFLNELKTFNTAIPYAKDFCQQKPANSTVTEVDNISTCFLNSQSFTEAVKAERKKDFAKKSKNKVLIVHAMSGQKNDKDCGVVSGLWSADEEGNIIRSTLKIKMPNGEQKKFDLSVLKTFLKKTDEQIQNKRPDVTIQKRNDDDSALKKQSGVK